MDVKAYTGRVHLQFRALQRRCLAWHEEVAQAVGVHSDDLWTDFQNYAMVATRITPDDKKHSKCFATGRDSADEVKTKFLHYLDLDVEITMRWETAIRTMDAPSDAVTAPEAETTDPE